jgi:alpha-tubulin suppressor-like RCC1 family protein
VTRSSILIVLLMVGGVARAADDPVRSLALGDEHSCALRRSGTVVCWGRNFSGQLGDGSREDRAAPVAVAGLDGVQQLVAFGARTCAARRDGSLWCWGRVEGLSPSARAGAPETWDATTPQRIDAGGAVTEVALGAEHACVRDGRGAVRCWGKNEHGQIGDGTQRARPLPQRVNGLPAARSLALGTSHSCALVEEGKVWCWGANEGGQLGDGTTHDRLRATLIRDFGGTVELAASAASTCARLANGTVRCWGWNSEGQLGDGTHQGHAIPKAVRGVERAVEISLGATTGCALRTDGAVVCWGDQALPPSEDDEHGRSLSPVEQGRLGPSSALARVGQIATGHQCVVQGAATVRCWGKNDHGQLGGASADAPTRVRVAPRALFGTR